MRARTIVIVAVAVAVCAGALYGMVRNASYEVKFSMPSAAQLISGSPVWIDGFPEGKVTGIDVQDGKAVVTATVDSAYAPLHEGTTSRVEWRSVLGERVLTLIPGPAKNPAIPSGSLYAADSSQVEADQVLAVLDAPTRARLSSLMARLDHTTAGRDQQIRATLRGAGPSVQALGDVLSGVGRDGPAIRELVSTLNAMVGGLAARQDDVSMTVGNLTQLTGNVARQQDQLAQSLVELPPTLDTARATLAKVPPATDATTPLLEKLRPATSRLPGVAGNLNPVLGDLRPIVSQLRPTLEAASGLLRETPQLFDDTHATVPEVGDTLDQLGPAVDFLRPYTPEAIAWLQNWGQDMAGYDSQGHMWSVGLTEGPSSSDDLPGPVPAVLGMQQRPAPGSGSGQPWTDANGSGIK